MKQYRQAFSLPMDSVDGVFNFQLNCPFLVDKLTFSASSDMFDSTQLCKYATSSLVNNRPCIAFGSRLRRSGASSFQACDSLMTNSVEFNLNGFIDVSGWFDLTVKSVLTGVWRATGVDDYCLVEICCEQTKEPRLV